MDFNHSHIISKDSNTNNETSLYKGYEYLAGSHKLDWDGIIVERLHTRIRTKQDDYYIFVMTLMMDINSKLNNFFQAIFLELNWRLIN